MSGDDYSSGRGSYKSRSDTLVVEQGNCGDSPSSPTGHDNMPKDLEHDCDQQKIPQLPEPARYRPEPVRRGRQVRPRSTGGPITLTRDTSGRVVIPSSVTGGFRDAYRQRIDTQGRSWTKLTSYFIDFFWEEFQKDCTWDPALTYDVRREWNRQSASAYKRFMNDLKTRPTEKDKRDIPQSVWDDLHAVWGSKDALKKSAQGKKNRRKGVLENVPLATHTGGSISMMEWAHRLAAELGRPADYIEIFEKLHMHRDMHGNAIHCKNPTEEMISERAYEVLREYKRLSQQAAARGTTLDSATKNNLFRMAAGDFDEKMQIYGLGSIVDTIPHPTPRRSKKGPSQLQTPTQYDDLSRSHYSFKEGMSRFVKRYKDDDDADDYGFGGGSGSGTSVH